jgi:hypothetical protein
MTAKISEPDEAHKSNRDDEILAREKNVRSLFPRDAKKKTKHKQSVERQQSLPRDYRKSTQHRRRRSAAEYKKIKRKAIFYF